MLQVITEGKHGENPLKEIDSSYIDKFSEFLHMFVQMHLHRVESNPHIQVAGEIRQKIPQPRASTQDYLGADSLFLLCKYTFRQPDLDTFRRCLEICDLFVQYISEHHCNNAAHLARFKPNLLLLATELLRKIQFSQNFDELSQLDTSTLNDDVQCYHTLEIYSL